MTATKNEKPASASPWKGRLDAGRGGRFATSNHMRNCTTKLARCAERILIEDSNFAIDILYSSEPTKEIFEYLSEFFEWKAGKTGKIADKPIKVADKVSEHSRAMQGAPIKPLAKL